MKFSLGQRVVCCSVERGAHAIAVSTGTKSKEYEFTIIGVHNDGKEINKEPYDYMLLPPSGLDVGFIFDTSEQERLVKKYQGLSKIDLNTIIIGCYEKYILRLVKKIKCPDCKYA